MACSSFQYISFHKCAQLAPRGIEELMSVQVKKSPLFCETQRSFIFTKPHHCSLSLPSKSSSYPPILFLLFFILSSHLHQVNQLFSFLQAALQKLLMHFRFPYVCYILSHLSGLDYPDNI